MLSKNPTFHFSSFFVSLFLYTKRTLYTGKSTQGQIGKFNVALCSIKSINFAELKKFAEREY